ncbi:hypothetical protein SprV_0200592600 [Sparganum proliferum]
MEEEEENNPPAALDALAFQRDYGGLKTKVFRKAANTMPVLNFNRNHPISHKRSCVRTYYRRVETHCSEPEGKVAELQYLGRVFKANGYPRNFVNRCMRKRDERQNRIDPKFWRAILNIRLEVTIRPTATAINICSCLPDLVQFRTKKLRRRNWKTAPDAACRTRGSGTEK